MCGGFDEVFSSDAFDWHGKRSVLLNAELLRESVPLRGGGDERAAIAESERAKHRRKALFIRIALAKTILASSLFLLEIHIPHQILSCFVFDDTSCLQPFHKYMLITVLPLVFDKKRFDLNSNIDSISCLLHRFRW